MEKKLCSICGEENDDYFHTLGCNHSFHYNCLLLSFKNMKNNHCPYCRSTNNFLPIVNGVKKIIHGIHDTDNLTINEIDNYTISKCGQILQRGKNKGKRCSRNCKLGYNYCQLHLKNNIKNDIKE